MTITPRNVVEVTWRDQGSSEWNLKKFIEHLQAQYDKIDPKFQASGEFVVEDAEDGYNAEIKVQHTRTQTPEEVAAEVSQRAAEAMTEETIERAELARLKAKYPDAA